MKVVLEFGTHHYVQEFKKVSLYCPRCGKKSVWLEQGSGDYYEGPDYCCTVCHNRFTMPSSGTPKGAWLGVIKQLKSGIPVKPISKQGD